MRKGPLVVYNEDNGIVPGMWNLPGVETCQLKDTVPQYFRNALLFLGYTDPTDLNTIPPVDRLTLAVDLGVATLVGEGGSEYCCELNAEPASATVAPKETRLQNVDSDRLADSDDDFGRVGWPESDFGRCGEPDVDY
eukprot:350620_1